MIDGSIMKTATVADLRNNFARISRWIEAGEEVEITKRGKKFARLRPETSRVGEATPEWPDRSAWRKRVFPKGSGPTSAEDIVDYDRGES
jgi:antitoxin (DNA-binding transcriptional repressor) of toxin-antitoxin stability system